MSGPLLPHGNARIGLLVVAGALAAGTAVLTACGVGDDEPNDPTDPTDPGDPNTAYEDQIIVRLKAQADLTDEARLARGADRREAVWKDLVATGERTQAPVRAALEALQKTGAVKAFESLYLPNAIIVTVGRNRQAAVEDALRGMAEVEDVTANDTWATHPKDSSVREATRGAGLVAGSTEWSVSKVGAPAAWARGYDGSGITVGVIDTGLDADHPAISSHYRGTSTDGTQDHNYNWFDATSAAKDEPYDDDQHGTHVAGSVAGGTPTRATGVAPGAKIMAAKGLLGSGYNTTVATMKALQWMLAPTDTDGNNPDPRRGADIINNSWGSPDRDDRTFVQTWEGLRAAGTIPVSAAGNDGPGTATVHPPGAFPDGISVAASTSGDSIASFSSRGPSAFDRNAIVPLIAAPGQSVTSAVPGGGYASLSGTSMASPHVAGAVAVLLDAKPDATYDEIVAALTATATDIDRAGVDQSAGYGRINVDRAVEYLLAH